jgi:hypothetical protein
MTPNLMWAPAAEETSTPVEPLYIRDDGYIVNPETGEIIRHEDDPFCIVDESTADWVIERMAEADARLAGLRAEKEARISALRAQFERREKEIENKRRWLSVRFMPELLTWAQTALTAKSRTVKLPSGSVSFRKVPGSTKVTIIDNRQAVAWAEEHAPNAVKRTEPTVLVSVLKGRESELPASAFDIDTTGERETFAVDTGIEKWCG